MKNDRVATLVQVIVASLIGSSSLQGETILSFNNPGATNLDSFGEAMDESFTFSIGVFANDFIPTSQNLSSWLTHWTPAASAPYNSGGQRYVIQTEITSNLAPFIVGTPGWIFGRREIEGVREWLLFRRTTWTWPAPNPINPFQVNWNVETVDAPVYGTVNSSGTPQLMQAALVPVSYDDWQLVSFAGGDSSLPNDDPDGDGVSNLLEFISGSDPLDPSSQPQTTMTLIEGHPRYEITRRADRVAHIEVQVSNDLRIWETGPEHVETLSESSLVLTVRDRTPVTNEKRFMRLHVTLPTPD